MLLAASVIAALTIGATPAELRGLDLISLDYVVLLDPASAETSGSLAITIRRASDDDGALTLALDAGLTVRAASLRDHPEVTVNVTDTSTTPLRIVALSFDPPLAVGDERVVDVTYDGTLVCNTSDIRGHRACKSTESFGYLRRESVLPNVDDAADVVTYEHYRRTLSLTLPDGVDAIASADVVSEASDAGRTTRIWQSDVVHDVQDLVVVFGDLESIAIDTPGDLPLRLWYPAGDTDWLTELEAWTAAAMPFHAALAGTELPFAQVDVVKLPEDPGFDGTATTNMVLLSEGYGDDLGAGNFEKTWAHELSHLWWGNLAFSDERGWWLLEGLARHAELAYMDAQYPYAEPGYDAGDGFGRSRWHAVLMRYLLDAQGHAPLVLGGIAQPPSTIFAFTVWAYARGAATLDHLRAVVGADAFATGLARWASDCAFVRCTSADFRTFMEEASGEDLEAFFAQHVFGTTFADLALSFTQRRTASGVDVTLTFTQEPAAETTVELWVTLLDGAIEKRVVDLEGAGGELTIAASDEVLSVRPNRYHDPIVWSRSAIAGDVDFDGAVDGVDLVTCAQDATLAFPDVSEVSNLFEVVPIDFRCDLDANGLVDRADLALIAAAFGTLEAGLEEAP